MPLRLLCFGKKSIFFRLRLRVQEWPNDHHARCLRRRWCQTWYYTY